MGWPLGGWDDDDHGDSDDIKDKDIKDIKDIKDAPDKHTQVARKRKCRREKESQWLNMDVRQLDESVLGK